MLTREFISISLGLLNHRHNVTIVCQQSYRRVKYSKLYTLRPQVKSFFVHDVENYHANSHIVNNKLYHDTRDVLLNQDFHIQLEIVQTRHPHCF
jgi:hypothetical protein